MGLFTKAHWLKPISLISHTSFLGHVSFCYCRTSADSKRKKTPKFWFCSSVGPVLHVQPGPKANKRNRWHPSKGSHPGSISHYTNLQALLHNKWLHSSIQCAFWIPMSNGVPFFPKEQGSSFGTKKSHSPWSCRNPLLWVPHSSWTQPPHPRSDRRGEALHRHTGCNRHSLLLASWGQSSLSVLWID